MTHKDKLGFSVEYFLSGHSGAGWYWFDTEYPEEGASGPYSTMALCIIAGRIAVGDDDAQEIEPDG